jgi:hypothetical protein
MRPDERRAGENEALYREVNERVRDLNQHFGLDEEELVDFVCECAQLDCTERIRLTTAEYERLRESALRFAVLPGHERVDIETVIEATRRFNVVEKHPGGPAALAAEQDPR